MIEMIFGMIYPMVPYSIVLYPIEMILVLLSVLIGWIVGPWYYYYDSKKKLKRKNYHYLGLEHSYHPWKLFDSGLMIISSHPSAENGFMSWKKPREKLKYTPLGIMKRFLIWTEQFANKGAQWAYFEPDILILNVHLAGPYVLSEITKDQLGQLMGLIERLKRTFSQSELSIYCVGDFNCNSKMLKDFLREIELTNTNPSNHATHWSGNTYDYILTNRPMILKIHTPPGCSRFFRLSDHSLLEASDHSKVPMRMFLV